MVLFRVLLVHLRMHTAYINMCAHQLKQNQKRASTLVSIAFCFISISTTESHISLSLCLRISCSLPSFVLAFVLYVVWNIWAFVWYSIVMLFWKCSAKWDTAFPLLSPHTKIVGFSSLHLPCMVSVCGTTFITQSNRWFTFDFACAMQRRWSWWWR